MRSTKLLLKTTLIGAMAISPLAFAGNQSYKTDKTSMKHSSMTGSSTAEIDGRNVPMSSSIIRDVEKSLNKRGHKINRVDGVMDAETTKAIGDFQTKENLEVTSRLNKETLDKLGINYKAAMKNRANRETFAE